MGRKPLYQREPWLREKYVDERMTVRDIAEDRGVTHPTVLRWMDRHGIDRRGRGEKVNIGTVPSFYTLAGTGYEMVKDGGKSDTTTQVHRLCAVAWFGYDAVVGKHVHHTTNVPWDNRESSLEPLTPSEHSAHHASESRFWEYSPNHQPD